ncbi:hypothetical protein [Bradyrhizobium sp. 150]|uniref:hypothetical protein n=1 Tax=Bradyrhizobium sp. 150 TaxID=2782625 RepID=UPI001FF960C1|nr:hypothetical protein [Bradyrhizobium sp. 150]MCK1671244.1 hypothetical protein [Bradyrhizobium sp. 150]
MESTTFFPLTVDIPSGSSSDQHQQHQSREHLAEHDSFRESDQRVSGNGCSSGSVGVADRFGPSSDHQADRDRVSEIDAVGENSRALPRIHCTDPYAAAPSRPSSDFPGALLPSDTPRTFPPNISEA